MKKILVIAPAYFPSNGGVENHIRSINRILKKSVELIVVVRYHKDLPTYQKVDGVEVWRLPKRDSYLNLKVWFGRHKAILENVTTIHSHDYYPRALRKLCDGIDWIHTFHGYEGYPLHPDAISSRQKLRQEVRWCAGVGRFIEKWYGTKCDYITYGAADRRRFEQKGRVAPKWDFIFYGRLERDTGFEAYMQAFVQIVKNHPKSSLLVVGSGSLKSWSKDLVAEHKLPVTFMPAQNNVEHYLHQSRIAFVSGYLAIIECALAQKPIVAYYGNPLKHDYLTMHPIADTIDIIGSSELIAKAADETLKPDAQRLKKAHKWAIRQTWESIAETYKEQYER